MKINKNEIAKVWSSSGTSGTIYEFETTEGEVGYASTVDGDYDIPVRFIELEDNLRLLAYDIIEWFDEQGFEEVDGPICLEWYDEEISDPWNIRVNRVVNGGYFYAEDQIEMDEDYR